MTLVDGVNDGSITTGKAAFGSDASHFADTDTVTWPPAAASFAPEAAAAVWPGRVPALRPPGLVPLPGAAVLGAAVATVGAGTTPTVFPPATRSSPPERPGRAVAPDKAKV
jgi:hypothetical protein